MTIIFNPECSFITSGAVSSIEQLTSSKSISGHVISRVVTLTVGTAALLIDALMHLTLGVGKLVVGHNVDSGWLFKATSGPLEPNLWNHDQGKRHIRRSLCLTGSAIANLGLWVVPGKMVELNRKWGLAETPVPPKLVDVRFLARKTFNLAKGVLRLGLAPVAGAGIAFAPIVIAGTLAAGAELTTSSIPVLAFAAALGTVGQYLWIMPGALLGIGVCWRTACSALSSLKNELTPARFA